MWNSDRYYIKAGVNADTGVGANPLLATLMLDRQEKDGSWWDYPLYDYHQPYGTAFALMSLHRCLPVTAAE